jgi:hypothetical protein
MSRKINGLVLKKRWPRNDTDVEDDPYIPNTYTFLQHGNGPTSGGQHN